MTETWIAPLQGGESDVAWDAFIGRYRRLIFAAIRHYARDYDEVMEIFAHVCEALRTGDLRKLRDWAAEPAHRAKFSTWLVTVVRHSTVDWFRKRDGRRRLPALVASLPPLHQRIFALVFMEGLSHIECYEQIRTTDHPDLTFRRFLAELRAVYQKVTRGRAGLLLPELGQVPPPDPELEEPGVPSEWLALVERELATLPDQDRVAVELYVIEGLPAADVARIVGLPNAKAVYNRTYRALEALRERLDAAGVRREDL